MNSESSLCANDVKMLVANKIEAIRTPAKV